MSTPFQESECSESSVLGTVTPTTNSNFVINTDNTSLRKRDGLNILSIQIKCTSPGVGWVQIGTLDVSAINTVYTRITGSDNSGISLRILGNVLQASAGVAGVDGYRAIIPFFSV